MGGGVRARQQRRGQIQFWVGEGVEEEGGWLGVGWGRGVKGVRSGGANLIF